MFTTTNQVEVKDYHIVGDNIRFALILDSPTNDELAVTVELPCKEVMGCEGEELGLLLEKAAKDAFLDSVQWTSPCNQSQLEAKLRTWERNYQRKNYGHRTTRSRWPKAKPVVRLPSRATPQPFYDGKGQIIVAVPLYRAGSGYMDDLSVSYTTREWPGETSFAGNRKGSHFVLWAKVDLDSALVVYTSNTMESLDAVLRGKLLAVQALAGADLRIRSVCSDYVLRDQIFDVVRNVMQLDGTWEEEEHRRKVEATPATIPVVSSWEPGANFLAVGDAGIPEPFYDVQQDVFVFGSKVWIANPAKQSHADPRLCSNAMVKLWPCALGHSESEDDNSSYTVWAVVPAADALKLCEPSATTVALTNKLHAALVEQLTHAQTLVGDILAMSFTGSAQSYAELFKETVNKVRPCLNGLRVQP